LPLAILAVLTPGAILTATLPGKGNNGLIDIGSLWLWHEKARRPTLKSHDEFMAEVFGGSW
jgi:hypothetical protein